MEKIIHPQSKASSISTNWLSLAEILIVMSIPIFLIIFTKSWVGDDLMRGIVIVWTSYIIMFLIILIGLKLRNQSIQEFGIHFQKPTFSHSLKVLGWSIVVFVLGTGGFILGSILMANITGIPESADFSNYEYLRGNIGMLILTLAGVYVISSFGEEVIFRAFLITRISELLGHSRIGIYFAVIVSAIIFGLAHYEWGAMGVIQTGFMGLMMGIFYIWLERRLWILVIAHMYMDTLLIVPFYFGGS